jgi:hypothetical protein
MGHATRAKVVSLARQWPLARPRRGEENRQRSNATDRRLVMGATSLSTTAYRRRIRRGNDPPRGYRTAHIENERARRRSRRWRKRRFVQCLGERPSFAGPARIADAIGLDTRRNRPRATGLAPAAAPATATATALQLHRRRPRTAPADAPAPTRHGAPAAQMGVGEPVGSAATPAPSPAVHPGPRTSWASTPRWHQSRRGLGAPALGAAEARGNVPAALAAATDDATVRRHTRRHLAGNLVEPNTPGT